MHLKLKGVALMKLDEKELYSLNVHVLTSKYKQLGSSKQMDCLNFYMPNEYYGVDSKSFDQRLITWNLCTLKHL